MYLCVISERGNDVNCEKTGEFIAKLRTELSLTQKELADRIGVTDKAVSKWETGRGFPDVGVLEILAKELGVSVTELMNGERFVPEKASSQADSAVLETLRYIRQIGRKTVGVIVIIIGACLCLAPLVMAGAGSSISILILGVLVILGGVFMIANNSLGGSKIPRMAYELISLGALAAAIVLELLPNGVVLCWGTPPGEPLYRTFHSYFDPTPYGMAHFSPLITAGLTVIASILTIIALIIGKRRPKLCNALFIFLIVTAAISICPVLYGFKYVTAIGVFITAALVVSVISRAAANAKK